MDVRGQFGRWVLATVLLGLQGVAQQPGLVTLEAHARAVVLDVVVTDRNGHAVHGLKAADFQVLEDGAPQTVAGFEEVTPPSEAQRLALAGQKLPVNTFSNASKVLTVGGSGGGAYTVLLLDALDTAPEWQAFGYEQLKRWVDTLQVTGPVAIFSLSSSLHMVQGFTTDPEALRRAVHAYQGVVLNAIPQGPGYVARSARFGGLTGSLRDLSVYLAKFPGRKNLIWFTGSIPVPRRDDGSVVSGPMFDPESFNFDFASTADVLTLGRISLYPVDVEGLRTDPAFDASRSGVPSVREPLRFNTEQANKHSELQEVAQATGGKAYFNTNGITRVIGEVVETGSNFYTLTYYPTNKNWDGSYRKLKLEVDQAGDELEYRRGYFALKEVRAAGSGNRATRPEPAPDASPRRQITNHSESSFAQAMHLGALDPGTIVFETHVAPYAGEQRLAKGAPLPKDDFMDPKYRDKPFREYRVDFKVAGGQFKLTRTPAGMMAGQVEFALVLLDDAGQLVNSVTTTIDMTLKPETYAYVLANGVQCPVKIAVPVKGKFFLRAGVHDVPSDRGGALEVSVETIQPEPGTP